MRAFYVVDVAEWNATPARRSDCVEVSRADGVVNVLAPVNPHPGLEAMGGLCLGTGLAQLETDDAKHFANVVVDRAGERLIIPATEIGDDDVVVPGSWMPRVMFAGDTAADYV